jgi:hypothetical protein
MALLNAKYHGSEAIETARDGQIISSTPAVAILANSQLSERQQIKELEEKSQAKIAAMQVGGRVEDEGKSALRVHGGGEVRDCFAWLRYQ